jgi:predicted  nucleic acid-binding Zn-ribbon protein
MEWWQTTLIAGGVSLLVGTVPGVIFFVLNRKGANKKLEIEEGGLTVNQFDVQTKAYQDLLDRANKNAAASEQALKEALAELETYKSERVKLMDRVREQGEKIAKLEGAADDTSHELADTRNKLDKLRKLFTDVMARTGIQLTPEEQAVFEETKPKWVITKELEGGANAQ